MIKTGRVEGKETGTLEMSGTLNDLMNDYNVIAKGMRKILVEKFGKEDGDKVFDILSSDKPRDGLREEVHSVIDEHLENEFKKSKPTRLLKVFMNMFDKGKTFEDGKKYVFDAELCREDLSSMGALSNIANVWINDCDGKEVIVKSSILGLIGTFSIFPEWCREVK